MELRLKDNLQVVKAEMGNGNVVKVVLSRLNIGTTWGSITDITYYCEPGRAPKVGQWVNVISIIDS